MARRSTVGLTRTAGWQVGVSKTVHVGRDDVWRYLVGPGLPRWLGVEELGGVGARWTSGSAAGEVRSLTRPVRVRVTHRVHGGDHETTVQVALRPAATGTTIVFHQERMLGPDEREQARTHWAEVAERLARDLAPAGRPEPADPGSSDPA